MSDPLHISAAIQTHPIRAALAEKLAAHLPGCDTVTDPDPDGVRSPWRTYRHALERTPGFSSDFKRNDTVTHRLILQDDVVPCPHFYEAVEAAVAARPERLLAFFVGGQPIEHSRRIYHACDAGESWAELDNMRWCPVLALCWPTEMIAPFLRFVDGQQWPETFRSDDEIVGRWLRDAGLLPLASVPSLVEHPDDVPSLIGQRAMGGADTGRVAACLIPEDCDARTIDWTLGPS